jgi:hypothetical protein
MSTLQRIRRKILDEAFALSAHALNDKLPLLGLEREDVIRAMLNGRIERQDVDDPRGTVYHVVGQVETDFLIEMPCRFSSTGVLIIITVYRY